MSQWTKEWPTEPGYYWICGYIYNNSEKIDLQMGECLGIKDLISVNGTFYTPYEAGKVVWYRIENPKKIPQNLKQYLLLTN
ncbi:MAG: hypothetical protein ABIJ08_02925 [Nanoarchaeota archaeon]